MAYELMTEKKNMLSLVVDNKIDKLIKPLTNEIFLFDTYIAGTSHVTDDSVFDDVKIGDKLILEREADNIFDEKAILVLDEKGRKLGYIPERDNTVFSRLMDGGKLLTAKVDYIERLCSFSQINISIYLVDF